MSDLLEFVMRRDVLEIMASLAALFALIPLVWAALALEEWARRKKGPSARESSRQRRRRE
jgi:hypothetical protein